MMVKVLRPVFFKIIFLTALFWGILIRLILTPGFLSYDVLVYAKLAKLMDRGGLPAAYSPNTNPETGRISRYNLPPGSLYLTRLASLGSSSNVSPKIPGILGDLTLSLLAFWFFRKSQAPIRLSAFLVLFFNPALIYLSSIWGQFDSLVSFFAYAGAVFLLSKFVLGGLFFLGLSLFIKYTLLTLGPLILITCLKLKLNLKKIILVSAALVGLFILLALPFGFTPAEFGSFYLTHLWDAGYAPTINATNFWGIFYHPHNYKAMTVPIHLGLVTVEEIGLSLFGLIYLLILMRWWRGKREVTESFFPAAALVTYSAFLSLPHMHERYLFPVFFPLLIWSIQARSKFIFLNYVLVSLLFFLNLYLVLPVNLGTPSHLVNLYLGQASLLPISIPFTIEIVTGITPSRPT